MSTAPSFDGTQACIAEPEAFFPASNDRSDGMTRAALATCHVCPFRAPCLDYAMRHAVEGIWGESTTVQRKAWRSRNGVSPIPLPTGFSARTKHAA